ncbi:occlusion derived envelope protein [Choristoneura fumiferana multiple nucleopolyhedrovirus]|uniref:Occlusion derived envelope protein n=1 Tax=Choristoneura fumiferana nuclear polyhedrosis virus TaxID=208973 RepID=Q9YP06_NPVCF|nr:occlusion derived envelope protein [Choristoneura fumiferana multiple nucleopolyhedrovirus]AAD10310.1 occlusion derived envelope protein [Choristoneura fumiferana multiple nucleopolyhedrovirus]
MIITLILVVAVILLIILFASTSNATVDNKSTYNVLNYSDQFSSATYDDELLLFEQWFKDNLTRVFAKKAEKVANPTRTWNTETVFDNLSPWTSATDFGTVCHTLIGYCVRYNNYADALYQSPELADNLVGGLRMVCVSAARPGAAPTSALGASGGLVPFTITMPEVFMNATIVLNETRHYEEAAELTRYWLSLYLPTAVNSLGWHRTAGNAIRMGVPYVYSQLLRGHSLRQIAQEPSVQETLRSVAFPFVSTGNGLHHDSIYIDHLDVRAYGYLINSFFTFAYYTRLFGANAVNNAGLTRAIENVGSPEGVVVPGVMSRNGTLHSNVIGNFVEYPIAVHAADLSKVLTKLSDTYYGGVVGATTRLAYYEADPVNNTQAPLWTMTRRIWNRRARIINYNSHTVPFESGVILQSLTGILRVPSTTSSTQSFRPAVGNTALAKTRTAGAILINARFAEMNNLQFKSCTLFYDHGMFQLYYNIGVEPDSLNNVNGRVVILSRDTSVTTNDLSFELQRANNDNSSEGTTFNGVVCHRVPITNFTVPSLTVRSPNANVELVEQIINVQSMYSASATAWYKLNVEGHSDVLRAFRIDDEEIYVNTSTGVKALFAYPWLVLKEEVTVVFMSANEDVLVPFSVITNAFNAINEPSLMYSPNNCYLHGNGFKLKDDTISLQFIFDIIQ